MSEEIKRKLKQTIFYTLIFIVVSWVLIPLIISALYAFASSSEYYNPNRIIPHSFTVSHIKTVLITLGALKGIKNSILVALLTITISFILGVPAGYSLAKFVFPLRDSIKLSIVGLKVFPLAIMAVPLVKLYIRLRLIDTLLGVALAHAVIALPYVIFIT
ncbi:carbohydrate ABC transporter permease, partial [Thermococci archaeon]